MTANGAEGFADKCYLRSLAAEFSYDLVETALGEFQCLRIAIEADQSTLRSKPPGNLSRVAREPECAICNDAACAYIQKLNRIL
jgi:hypothetical protein